MSFRSRLLLAAFYLTAAAVLALSIPLALTVEQRADSDYEAAVLGDAAILAARVSDLVVPAVEPPSPRLDRLVAESARTRDQRVVVTDAAGRVIADSASTATSGQLFATNGRPEFRAALFQGRIDTRTRFSDTLGEDLLLVTVPVVDRGRVVGAVRLSAGTEAVDSAVRASWVRLAVLGGVVIVAGVLVAWLLELPLGRQIRRLAEASTRLGQGDLSARAPVEGPEELRVLAASFNQMATDLEHSIEAQREFVAERLASAADATHRPASSPRGDLEPGWPVRRAGHESRGGARPPDGSRGRPARARPGDGIGLDGRPGRPGRQSPARRRAGGATPRRRRVSDSSSGLAVSPGCGRSERTSRKCWTT